MPQVSEAVPWLRRSVAGLSPRRPGLGPRPVCVRFDVHTVSLTGAVYLPVLRVSCPPSVSFHQSTALTLIYRPSSKLPPMTAQQQHTMPRHPSRSLAIHHSVLAAHSQLKQLTPTLSEPQQFPDTTSTDWFVLLYRSLRGRDQWRRATGASSYNGRLSEKF